MSTKKTYPDDITRDDINEAMARFFEKGGTIKKLEGSKENVIHESFDTSDSFLSEEEAEIDINFINPFNGV